MITPADLARMLQHADDAAVNHAQNYPDEERPLWTSESAPIDETDTRLAFTSISTVSSTHTQSGPTPANMPQKRTTDGPTTFASLDAQELPVVREYSAGGLVFEDRKSVV